MIRRSLLALAVALLAAANVGVAGSAQATTYRYWTYWHGSATGWHYANAGPYFTKITSNGDPWVDGWRFASSDPYGPLPPKPDAPTDYKTLTAGRSDCVQTSKAGWVRVAIVIDFGSLTDVPKGDTRPNPEVAVACALVPSGTDAFTALQGAHYANIPVRADSSSFICGIDGYPSTECADVNAAAPAPPVTPSPSPTATRSRNAGSTPSPTIRSTSQAPTANSQHPSPSSSASTASAPAVSATTSTFAAAPLPQPAKPGRTKGWPALFSTLFVVLIAGLAVRSSRRRRH